MKKTAIALSIILTAVCLAGCARKQPAPASNIQFSALIVVQEMGVVEQNRVYFTRDRQRVDILKPDKGISAIIVRFDKGVAWVLVPTAKKYLESPLRPQNRNPLAYYPDRIISWTSLGDTTIDGHPAMKEALTYKNGGDPEMTITRWFATDINWPVRAEAIDGSWKMYYKDIKVGAQDPSLFEVPAGYTMIPSPPETAPADGK